MCTIRSSSYRIGAPGGDANARIRLAELRLTFRRIVQLQCISPNFLVCLAPMAEVAALRLKLEQKMRSFAHYL